MAEAGTPPGLDGAAFARAFPFHLRLDPQLCISAFGASLAVALPTLTLTDPLTRHFEVRRPRDACTVEHFRAHGTHLVTLRALERSDLILRGSAEVLDDGSLLLVVSPVLQSLEAMHSLGLDYSHFARHDGVADMLLLARTSQTSVADAQRLAERLRAHTARLDTILELGQNGVAAFDAEGVLRHTNQALRDMLQLPSADAIGMTLAQLEQQLQRLLDPGRDTAAVFVEDAAANSEPRELAMAVPRPAVLRVRSRRAPDGGLVFYLRDVTAESEVDRMKSEFLSTAAHELRTPMVSVYGFTELLDLARIEARQGRDLKRHAQALGPLLRLAVDGMAGRSESHQFIVNLDHADAHLLVDTEKFVGALTNVLANAVKYSPAGGEVRVQTLDGLVIGQPAVGIRVTDPGIGMTAEQGARIFERFYRADPSGNIPGTGLGMSLVREITSLHGGDVTVESQPGVGTTVTLWWPLSGVLQGS
ncbi:MAG: PAS-domain containing protein [Burkholderiaceae bacterium]|nr:PAS-domain containing protein [Rhodoferax sp.]MCP5287458.1 PAS-domain containing protein [Burkholderiaceae bacterium]